MYVVSVKSVGSDSYRKLFECKHDRMFALEWALTGRGDGELVRITDSNLNPVRYTLEEVLEMAIREGFIK